MSLLSRLMDTMRLGPEEDDEDYYLDDDFEEEAPRKPLFGKKNSAEYDEEEEPPEKPRFLGRSNPKVVPMRRGMEVTTIKPTSMEDSRDICDFLLAGKVVVLNMEGIHTDLAQRIIDFTSGATYSMNGNLRRYPAISLLRLRIPWSCPGSFRIFCPAEAPWAWMFQG